ncbi:lytic murein transglycosylase [Elioraea sp. Yellowstone]|uniref:lytic murein transglycosylase n=1 Tax=Elioraea sp. Yellowstone TaxID=2592070 RepID=UPI001153FA81|nr:lytic murein transglycosylase [Elioraea sp. Yellowstone]TQF79518.1 lytic murein transglycosylase [Elioraea sp. Yellowstone]
MHTTRPTRRLLLGAAAAAAAWPARAAVPFETWLVELRAEARRQGISAATVQRALSGIAPIPRVIELDRRQPETRLTWAQYRDRVVAEPRIGNGRAAFAENRALLAAVEERFGVSARAVTAIWGVETNYGTTTGGFPVIQALATLAHDGRRAAFFRGELLNALRILDQGHIALSRMTGSWAGAMGQPQFMPGSFLAYAVDFDGDGRRDIWDSRADALGSIGNYLARANWRPGEPWGAEVRLPPGFDIGLADGRTMRPMAAWGAMGVRRADGRPLGESQIPTAIAAPDGADGQAFAIHRNAQAIRRYNNSIYYVLAVGLLSDLVAG